MKRKATLFLAGLAAAVTMGATTASAQPLIGFENNDFFYVNFESAFDADGNHKALSEANPLVVGDHFFGIFNIQNISVGANPSHWFQSGTDQISGVFAQRVESVYIPPVADPFDPAQTNLVHVTLGLPTISSFTRGADTASTVGLLGPGEMFSLYHQTGGGTTVFEANGTMADDLAKATDGTKFFSLGFSPGADLNYETLADNTGFFYSHANLPGPLLNFTGEAWGGLNVVFNGTGFPTFLGLNDPSENEMGWTVPFVTPLFTDVILSSELEPNPTSISFGGISPWDLRSNDPGTIHPTPEPSTMVLLGAGLLGLGAYTRKKFKK